MKKKKKSTRELLWWLYIVFAVMLVFVVPSLMSAGDTIAVIAGVLLMVLFGVVSWKFWVRPLITTLGKKGL